MTAAPDEPTKQVRVTTSWTPHAQPSGPAATSDVVRTLSPAARGAAAVPVTILALVNVIGLVLTNVPEVRLPELLRAFGQFGPLVSPIVVTLGASTNGTAITVAMVGAVVLAAVVRSGARNSVLAVGAAAALTALPLMIVLVDRLENPAPAQRAAAGLLLGVLAVGAALSVPVRLVTGGVAPVPSGARLFGWLAVYAGLVVVPFGVGRAAAGAGLVTLGTELWHPYVAGLAIGMTVWAFAQAFPPLSARRYGVALVAVAIALGPLLDLAAGRY